MLYKSFSVLSYFNIIGNLFYNCILINLLFTHKPKILEQRNTVFFYKRKSVATIEEDSITAAMMRRGKIKTKKTLKPLFSTLFKFLSALFFKTSRPILNPIAPLNKRAGISKIPCGIIPIKIISPLFCAKHPIKPPLKTAEAKGAMANRGPNTMLRKHVRTLFKNINTNATKKIIQRGYSCAKSSTTSLSC